MTYLYISEYDILGQEDDMANKDPVCGMDVRDAAITAEKGGTRWYFCSQHCRKTFLAGSEKKR
jgi:YHS domain-containing protein